MGTSSKARVPKESSPRAQTEARKSCDSSHKVPEHLPAAVYRSTWSLASPLERRGLASRSWEEEPVSTEKEGISDTVVEDTPTAALGAAPHTVTLCVTPTAWLCTDHPYVGFQGPLPLCSLLGASQPDTPHASLDHSLLIVRCCRGPTINPKCKVK